MFEGVNSDDELTTNTNDEIDCIEECSYQKTVTIGFFLFFLNYKHIIK